MSTTAAASLGDYSGGDVEKNDFNFTEAVNRLENSLTLIQHSVPNTEKSDSSNNNSEESHHRFGVKFKCFVDPIFLKIFFQW